MRIAISSKSGCGNTTVSKLVAERLGCKMINFTFRQMAEERGVDFWTFCTMAENDDSIDKELDARHLKVYLRASEKTRAERIFKREGGSFEERFKETKERDEHDRARYKRIYGIDNDEYDKIADLVIDTDSRRPEEIADLIIREAEKKRG